MSLQKLPVEQYVEYIVGYVESLDDREALCVEYLGNLSGRMVAPDCFVTTLDDVQYLMDHGILVTDPSRFEQAPQGPLTCSRKKNFIEPTDHFLELEMCELS